MGAAQHSICGERQHPLEETCFA
ncbi:hypothetical protein RSAG8_04049, partial [Rhizoctonia solani AG-8 WAC10335]